MSQSSGRARARRLQRQVTQNLTAVKASTESQHQVLAPASAVATSGDKDPGTRAALLTIDTIAKGSLLPQALNRYEAYKLALLENGEDVQAVVIALSLFVWDLIKRRSNSTLH
jgi:hypothetical protein